MAEFDFATRCCFCGEDNRNEPRGYAGERTCGNCGKGGFGEPDEPVMAYKGNTPASAAGSTEGYRMSDTCTLCGKPQHKHKRCPLCGYSRCDAAIHLDHNLCKGTIPGSKPKASAPSQDSTEGDAK